MRPVCCSQQPDPARDERQSLQEANPNAGGALKHRVKEGGKCSLLLQHSMDPQAAANPTAGCWLGASVPAGEQKAVSLQSLPGQWIALLHCRAVRVLLGGRQQSINTCVSKCRESRAEERGNKMQGWGLQ